MIEQPVIDPASPLDLQTEGRAIAARKRRRFLAAALALLLAVIVLPPFININRFRRSIVHSISAGLGRPVEASSVELELFPRPGFVLHNLTVGEDPAYGAEPVMMAQTVTASLRASTLWHARVEIASLRFDAPSVNLVRDAQGHWNFESLLRNSPALRSRRSSASSSPLPFPYVEATDARINFKLGPEKLPFSLESANLAVWKGSSNEWRLRIKARPVRTDLTVEDAGQIRGQGVLRTAGTLVDAGIQASLEWRRVQLGEISRLFHGEDDGWRGTADWTAKAKGTLADVSLTSDIAVEEFRRAEFVPATEMDLSAHCQARYAFNNPLVDGLQCDAPLGNGQLLLHGKLSRRGAMEMDGAAPRVGKPSSPTGPKRRDSRPVGSRRSQPPAFLQIALRHVSAGFFLDLFGHIHPGVASDATASGEVNGEANCDWRGLDTLSRCTGEIRSTELRLHLANLDRPLTLSPSALVSHPASQNKASATRSPRLRGNGAAATRGRADISAASTPASWKLLPIHVSLGGATPATIAGTMTSSGSALEIAGAASLAELDKLAQAFKIPAISGEVQSIRGDARLALSLESTWLPRSDISAAGNGDQPVQAVQSIHPLEFAPSHWTGSVLLHNVTLKIASLPLNLQLASARVNVTTTGVEWGDLDGTFAHIPFDGSIRWQTPCPTSKSACTRTFTLHTPDLNVGHFQAVLHQGGGASDLLTLINPWAGNSPHLPGISGTLDADLLSAGRISVRNAALKLRIEGQSAELMAISGKIFGGTLSGTTGTPDAVAEGQSAEGRAGSVRWGHGPPVYTLRIKLDHIQPDSVAAIWDEEWGPGTASAKIDMKTQGWSAADLAQNAGGKFAIAWLNGTLPTSIAPLSPAGSAIEKFQRWSAEGTIRNRTLLLASSELVPQRDKVQKRKRPAVAQSVSGTVTFGRVLDLKLQPAEISMTGPLSAPVVQPQTLKEQTQ